MLKDDRLQVRSSKGSKLILNMYCDENNRKFSDLFDIAIKEYFINRKETEIFALISLADKYIYSDKLSIDDVKNELTSDSLYKKIFKKS